MRLHSYTRFSHTSQSEGSSVERQTKLLNNYLARHPEFELVTSYDDLGKSGYHGEHLKEGAGLQVLLSAVKNGSTIKQGEVVVIEALDRLGRLPPMKMVSLVAEILEQGVSIITLEDEVTYTEESVNGQHLFLLAAKVQQAHDYSAKLSKRVAASYQARKAKAEAGETISRRTPFWLTSQGEVIPEKAELVTALYDSYLQGFGERILAQRLIDAGHPLHPSTIHKILQDRTVIGYWNDIRCYPQVVSETTFYAAQAERQRRKPQVSRQRSTWFLAGLVKCSICGSNLNFSLHRGTSPTGRCAGKQRLACDSSNTMPYQVLTHIAEPLILDHIQDVIHDKGNNNTQTEDTSQLQAHLDGLFNELDQLIEQSGRQKSQLVLDRYNKRIAVIEANIQKLEIKMEEAVAIKSSESEYSKLLSDFIVNWDEYRSDPALYNRVLQRTGFKLVVNTTDKTIQYGDSKRWAYKRFFRKEGCYLVEDTITGKTLAIEKKDVDDSYPHLTNQWDHFLLY